jgi:cell division protein FtsL
LAPFLLLATVLVAGLVLAVAVLQALVAQNSFRMEDLGRKSAALRQENGELRLDVAKLSSPRRIANEARRLGLQLPDPAAVKTLKVRSTGSGPPSP